MNRSVQARASRAFWRGFAALKNAVVSNRRRYYKVRAGIAKGAILYTSARYGSRMLFGLYESEIASYMRHYVRSGDVCYDIGAADGYYALAFARLASPGRVFCFDADAGYSEQLQSVIARNRHLGSSIYPHHARIGARETGNGDTSLDALVYEHGLPPPRVIKVDVDGGELNVLAGAVRILREHHPRLIVEVHSIDLEQGCQRFLQGAGYSTTIVENRVTMAEDAFRAGHNRWLCAE